MTIPAWLTLFLAAPALAVGEWIVSRVPVLARYSIPVPVVGGLFVSVGVLAAMQCGASLQLQLNTVAPAWHWFVTAPAATAPAAINLPFLAAFFATVGLSASWAQVRRAGWPVLVFLAAVAAAAVMQNLVAVALARPLGVSPLFALLCGAMSLTGGHATTLGFAAEFERAGQVGAQTFGIAAATMGLVLGALVAGPVGSALCRRRGLRSSVTRTEVEPVAAAHAWRPDWRFLAREWRALLLHLILIAVCLKGGAWISYLLHRVGVVFPIFVGTLAAGVSARAALDRWWPGHFNAPLIAALATPALALFIATSMMTLDLRALAATAVPMLVILAVELVATIAFAWWITFRVMGADYEAAVMACGHLGFGLGSTATGVVSMKAMTEVTGPAPQAFLIVPLVGGFLVDLVNAANITAFINFFHG